MRVLLIGGTLLLSLLLFMLPFTGYILVLSTQPTVYERLVRNSGLFSSEKEIQEAGQILYQGLMQGRQITFSSQQAKLTEDEQKHMLDVSRLLSWNFYCFLLGLFLFFLLIILSYLKKLWKWLYYTGFGSLFLLVAILGFGLFYFDGLFTLFHRMLFRNNLWLLPPDSILLHIFSTGFFFRHFIGIFSVVCGWFFLVTVSANHLMKRSKA
ncbi:MAG: DUF1461 domain-containing protein [Caldisericia bacterium]|nr:DUF1461 domain-containing protein [Caldisericia bacterium]